MEHDPGRPPRLGRGLLQRAGLASLLIVLLVASAVASAGLLEVDRLVDTFRENATPIPNIDGALDGVDAGEPQTLLVLGSDRRFATRTQADRPPLSDTMMLVRLDPTKAATAVMSIPRDLQVTIPKGPHNGEYADKINAAYALGGPALSVRTVKRLLRIPINHVVNVNFGGFQRAVNRLGCVYVDVDRRYFNDNTGPGPDYATIDVPAGYQRLCGQDSLDYVRYRHLDDDLVRSARQQDYLRQAQDQIGFSGIWSDLDELVRIFGRYTDTDIDTTRETIQLLKLVLESSGHPIREVRFRGDTGPSYVTITPENLEITKRQFLSASASNGPPPRRAGAGADRLRAAAGRAPGIVDAKVEGEDHAARAATRLRFPVYIPRYRLARGAYDPSGPRIYTIADRSGKRYQAYRIVLSTGTSGQYYGVQGMAWTSPPILDNPTDEERIGGRPFQLLYDGSRIRLIAWRTPGGVYWVSNTLSKTLSNAQMRAIAGSLERLGGR